MTRLSCPKCRSTKLVKFGKVWSGGKKQQRYLCDSCGRATIKPLGVSRK